MLADLSGTLPKWHNETEAQKKVREAEGKKSNSPSPSSYRAAECFDKTSGTKANFLNDKNFIIPK